MDTERVLMSQRSNNQNQGKTIDEEKGHQLHIESEGPQEEAAVGDLGQLLATSEEEKCQAGDGTCALKSKYVCRAFYCCDEFGCEKRFCSIHRSKKCFLNDTYEPWPTVCVDCEVKVSRVSWIRCLVPTILVPTIAITLMILMT